MKLQVRNDDKFLDYSCEKLVWKDKLEKFCSTFEIVFMDHLTGNVLCEIQV